MSDTISSVIIGKLIEAHLDGDNEKFNSYANLIADTYEKNGNKRSADIIRKKMSGEYKNSSKVILD